MRLVGRAKEQTKEFLSQEVEPYLRKFKSLKPNFSSIEV